RPAVNFVAWRRNSCSKGIWKNSSRRRGDWDARLYRLLQHSSPMTFKSLPLNPRHPRIFLLQRRLDFGIAVRLERRPIESRLQPFAIRRAEPEFYRQSAFAYLRMLFESETFVEFHLQFGRIRLVLFITRLFRILQFQFPPI